jgi:hypothetical protein
MSNQLSHIIANANDFDGVFYNPHLISDYYAHFAKTFGATLISMLPNEIDFDSAVQLANDGYRKHGDCVTGLIEWADHKGVKDGNLRDKFFQLFHRNLKSHFTAVAPHVFSTPSEVATALSCLKGIVRNGIATHGCAREFTTPLLEPMGLAPHVEKNAIFGLADSGYLKKSTHPDLVQMCLDSLEVPAEVAAYTEDTALNLKAHKEMMPVLTTIFINNGNPLAKKPTYIDCEFRSFEEYLRALHAAHNEQRQIILIPR